MTRTTALLLTATCLVAAVAGPAAAETEGGPVQFLFIHHSCGGQLLADEGSQVGGDADGGERCIYVAHPNGGGLRTDLESSGFTVNEASYGSIVGQDTDICHWNAKFRDHMDRILRTGRQDDLLPDGLSNAVVAFKSCFPNNHFSGEGEEPGDPDDRVLTVANAKAAYRALLPSFEQQPDVLFVAFTAPPLADAEPVGLRYRIKRFFKGKPKHPQLARAFNTWLVDREHGWLAGYEGGNVVVFDHYDVLTKHGQTDWAAYPTQDGRNSHPSSEGNRAAAEAFVPFLRAAHEEFTASRP
ncbi:MAG: hypothetical protein GY838_00885 [bacterium]|nr:hypothetical protein [bacterium]